MDEIETGGGMTIYKNTIIIINGMEMEVNYGSYGFGLSILKEFNDLNIIGLAFKIEKPHSIIFHQTNIAYRYQVYLNRLDGKLLCDIICDPKITPVEEHLIAIHQFLKMRELAE